MPVLLSLMSFFEKVCPYTQLGLFRNFRAIEEHRIHSLKERSLPMPYREKTHQEYATA